MNRRDRSSWTLWALALAEGEPLSPVKLQKAVFLLSEKLPRTVSPKPLYKFAPHNYGPFCREVYDDAQKLARDGLVLISPAAGNYLLYSVTEEGSRQAKTIFGSLPSNLQGDAKRIVNWVRKQSFRSLVSAIYQEYPEYRANSIFAG
jgi:uncharacterized protein YwgA